MKILNVFLLAFILLFTLSACNAKKLTSEPEISKQTNLGISDKDMPDNFVLIKGGKFQMGSPDSEAWRGNDETQHLVTVGDFYMSRYELTQKGYQEIMGSNPSTFSGENLPVENVSWFDAIAYCNARSKKKA